MQQKKKRSIIDGMFPEAKIFVGVGLEDRNWPKTRPVTVSFVLTNRFPALSLHFFFKS